MSKVCVFLLLVLTCTGLLAKTLQPGATPPDNLGTTLAGQHVSTSVLRGKVVVISFWATWCRYCMKELPILGGLQAVAKQRGLPLQVVEINYKEDHRTFVRASNLLMPKLPGLLLTWDRTGALAKSFGLGNALPAMVMLHRDGTVADVEVGYDASMLNSLIAKINKLMNEPAPVPPTN